MPFFNRPIEKCAPRPATGEAYIRLVNLHGARAKSAVRFKRPLTNAAAARARYAQIIASDQAIIAQAAALMVTDRLGADVLFKTVVIQYRHVLELIVDGVTEERWVGQLDPTSMSVGAVGPSSYLHIAPWTPGPPANDPAWTEPGEVI